MPVAHHYPGRPLVRGSRGPHVRELQVQLNHLDGKHVTVDGYFGAETEAKVKAFQRNRHLGALGDVDAVIWDRLFGNPPPRLHPRDPETEADKLRRLREEVPVRQRQIHHEPPGADRRQLVRRYRKITSTIRRLVIDRRGPRVRGNRVTGGNPRQRLVLAAQTAARLDHQGRRRSFYSQDGRWTVDYAITGEPQGFRSDCSQWVTSVYRSCGLPDPNGENYTGGYTGTLAAHCRQISRSQLQPGDLILYGSGPPYHHVELYVGPGEQTIGHGSPPVDGGTVAMIAEPHFYTAF